MPLFNGWMCWYINLFYLLPKAIMKHCALINYIASQPCKKGHVHEQLLGRLGWDPMGERGLFFPFCLYLSHFARFFFFCARPPLHPMLAFLVISPCASRPLKKAYHDVSPPSSTILVFPR